MKKTILLSLIIHTSLFAYFDTFVIQNKSIILPEKKELVVKFITIKTPALKKAETNKKKQKKNKQKKEIKKAVQDKKKVKLKKIKPKPKTIKIKEPTKEQKIEKQVKIKKPEQKQEIKKQQKPNKILKPDKPIKKKEKIKDKKLKVSSRITKKEIKPKKLSKIDSIPIAVKIASMVKHARIKGVFKPKYPSVSRRRGEEGSVLLKIFINELGQVEIVKILKSSGYSRLDNAALKGAYNIQFHPAKKDNVFSASARTLNVRFELNG